MLQEIQRKIRINEGVLANAQRKLAELSNKKDTQAYWYWLGICNGIKSMLTDLKDLQEIAEQDVSSLDHCLDALRGL